MLSDYKDRIGFFYGYHPAIAAEAVRAQAAEVERYRLAERARLGLPPNDPPTWLQPRLSAADIRRKARRLDAMLRPWRYANRWKLARLRGMYGDL